MAEKKDEKVKNEVHENKIWIERVTKEKYNAKLTTVCNPNPRLAFFQFTPMHAFLVACFSGLEIEIISIILFRQRYFDGADKVNSKSALEEADPGFAQVGCKCSINRIP